MAGNMSNFRYALVVLGLSSCILGGCGKKLEKPYDYKEGLRRMNAVNIELTEGGHAEGMSVRLAIPDSGSFASDDIVSAASLLIGADPEGQRPLAYKNAYVKTYPASITKIMSALICLENIPDLEQEFTITKNSMIDVSGSSSAHLRVGEKLTIEQLLYAMLIPSGNDAAIAVAEATAGSVEQFVEMMNRRALELGATGTHFVNPHGLPDDDHFTTPYDIYLIMNEVLKYDKFREITGSTQYTCHYKDSNGIGKTQEWTNSNKYLNGEKELPQGMHILGGKTGTTNAAGNCLTVAVQKNGTDEYYIAVVMKDESKDQLYQDMTANLSKIF